MHEPDEPQRPRQTLNHPVLEPLSVAELRDYIAQLRVEITRAEVAIAAKENHRNAADAFFRQPTHSEE
jgi:uncharacterized small protein (DUF1192 family)